MAIFYSYVSSPEGTLQHQSLRDPYLANKKWCEKHPHVFAVTYQVIWHSLPTLVCLRGPHPLHSFLDVPDFLILEQELSTVVTGLHLQRKLTLTYFDWFNAHYPRKPSCCTVFRSKTVLAGRIPLRVAGSVDEPTGKTKIMATPQKM